MHGSPLPIARPHAQGQWTDSGPPTVTPIQAYTGADLAERVALQLNREPTARAERAATRARAETASVLIIFSGPGGRTHSLGESLRALGFTVLEVDIKIGGEAMNVIRASVAEPIETAVSAGRYQAVFLATPCESYSVARRPRLRTAAQPLGVTPCPEGWERYLAKHNALAVFTSRILRAATEAGVPAAVENPASRSDPASPAFWQRYSEHGSLWHMPSISVLNLALFTGAQCSFDAPVQKWTTLGANEPMAAFVRGLAARACEHGQARHQQIAHGIDAQGRSRSAMAAAYPPLLCTWLAAAIQAAVTFRREMMAVEEGIRQPEGGDVTDGITLTAATALACENARWSQPRFASLRNLRDASRADVAVEAFPGDVSAPMQRSTKPPRAAMTKKGRAHPAPIAFAFVADRGRPAGPILINMLYAPGLYDAVIQDWLQRASIEATKMLRGERYEKIETIVIAQDQMPHWARGRIFDCANPADCSVVERSTRDTLFPGPRQLDRQRFRSAAVSMGWHDEDIVQQVGEGGAEVRSDCPYDTVLSWHHRGVAANIKACTAVVEADMGEQWVSRPTPHLPFVPCRLLPRNVIMQERSRKKADGSMEVYFKPRVSQDSSDGAMRSVNGGVTAADRAVELPRAQQHARGLAICDTAGTTPADEAAGHRPVRAEAYAVDATSAFRFIPVQRADLWTQCFLWWDLHEEPGHPVVASAGICVDRRMGFGGAVSPNRFERVILLIAACIRRWHEKLDALQPEPPCATRWRQRRERAQQAGTLVDGPHQLHPRHIQCYIDVRVGHTNTRHRTRNVRTRRQLGAHTWITHPTCSQDINGSALNDIVTLPSALAGGRQPSTSKPRVVVHALMAIQVLRAFGLEAAPDKTLIGDPIISLGLRVDRKRWTVDCPAAKQEAIVAATNLAIRQAHQAPPVVDVEAAHRLVGRAVNLSQVLPEITAVLRGGFTIVCNSATSQHRGARHRATATSLTLRRCSTAHREWLDFLQTTRRLVMANKGVSLAPVRIFPSRLEGCTITGVTDASGDDGVGGYCFSAARKKDIWIVSEMWPVDIKAALDAYKVEKRKRAATGQTADRLSMPAAELFGAWAVPHAAIHHSVGMPVGPIYAIGDCDAAVGALNAASSPRAQMHELVLAARTITSEWLAVSIPREANVDADNLSHPERLPEVVARARAAGFTVHVARITRRAWATLRKAITAVSSDRAQTQDEGMRALAAAAQTERVARGGGEVVRGT